MRTTINIEDRLLRQMKAEAQRAGISLTQLANRALELGLQRLSPPPAQESRGIATFSMGAPRFEVDKALRLAGNLEDEEILRKLELRK